MLHLAMPFRMKKQFGQHFLRQVPKEILFPLDALEKLQSLQKPARVYIFEIGPGNGVVTLAVLRQLLPFSELRIVYEVVDIDREAIEATQAAVAEMGLPKRITTRFTNQDVLKHDFRSILPNDYAYIFGSLPYNVSKKVVNATRHFSQQVIRPLKLLPSRFIIQREVAEDYVSTPPDAAFLGTDLSLFSTYRKITKKLLPGNFYPPPKVESAVLEIGWTSPVPGALEKLTKLARTVRTGFFAKRKVINSVFKPLLGKVDLPPTAAHLLHMRAHELSVAEWELLASYMP
jgi:16S rRNA (adenine1518-N6/adenine1519-N6)-dimethyltransferase